MQSNAINFLRTSFSFCCLLLCMKTSSALGSLQEEDVGHDRHLISVQAIKQNVIAESFNHYLWLSKTHKEIIETISLEQDTVDETWGHMMVHRKLGDVLFIRALELVTAIRSHGATLQTIRKVAGTHFTSSNYTIEDVTHGTVCLKDLLTEHHTFSHPLDELIYSFYFEPAYYFTQRATDYARGQDQLVIKSQLAWMHQSFHSLFPNWTPPDNDKKSTNLVKKFFKKLFHSS